MVRCGHKTFKEFLQVLPLADFIRPAEVVEPARLVVEVVVHILQEEVVQDPVVVADTDNQ